MATPTNDDQQMIDAFNAVPDKGTLLDLDVHDSVPLLDQATHMQGMDLYAGKYVFSHNVNKNQNGGHGYLLLYPVNNQPLKYPIIFDDYRHPGGIQHWLELLAVPIEKDETGQPYSVVRFYNLNGFSTPTELPALVDRRSGAQQGGASCVGLAAHRGAFYLIVYTEHHVPARGAAFDVYVSDGTDINAAGFGFSWLFRCDAPHDYDNVAMLTKGDGLYCVGLRGEESGVTIGDYMDLYKVDIDNAVVTALVDGRHMHTRGGGLGVFKPHFRWGATAVMTSDTTMAVYCCERNAPEEGEFSQNVFGSQV